jgi:hypothetical protein
MQLAEMILRSLQTMDYGHEEAFTPLLKSIADPGELI